MSIFSFGKRIIEKCPYFLKIASFSYNLISFNFIRRGFGKNKIVKNTAFLSHCKIKINGTGNKIILGNKVLLKNCSIYIKGNNNLINLEDMVCVHNGKFHIEDNNNIIDIGKKSLICGPSDFSAIEGTTIKLGEGCLVSSDTFFRTGDSHSVLDLEGNRINASKDINLGNRIWVCHRATILKGVTMADDNIISTGAIVTKSFDECNAVIAGVPAKVIKNGIKWCKERLN